MAILPVESAMADRLPVVCLSPRSTVHSDSDMLSKMASEMVSVGSLTPDFHLPCTPRFDTGTDTVALADFRGRWLVLVFYPRDFSLVCPTELTALSARIDDFRRKGCEIVGVSCDSVESHLRWIATPVPQGGLEGLAFPLASDAD